MDREWMRWMLAGVACVSLALGGCGDDASEPGDAAVKPGDASLLDAGKTGIAGKPGRPRDACHSSRRCFTHAGVLLQLSRSGGAPASDMDAGDDDADAGPFTCPDHLPASSFCTLYSDLLSDSPDDLCCYIETTGTCC